MFQSGQLQPQARYGSIQSTVTAYALVGSGEEGQPGRATQDQPHLGDLVW